jgi:hypothetical protein
MFVRSGGIAEPAVIGDVDEELGARAYELIVRARPDGFETDRRSEGDRESC